MARTLTAVVVLGLASVSSCVNGRRGEAESVPSNNDFLSSAVFGGSKSSNQGAAEMASAKPSETLAFANAIAAHSLGGVPSKATPALCPAEMALVSGQYCTNVEHRCTRWLETDGRYAFYRCAEYARPAKCTGKRRPMHYCIDRDEYVPPGQTVPVSNQSWTVAQETCSSLGKRVCLESEWQFACEGEEMRPYPYGFTRDADACNADRIDIYRVDGQLRDLRDGPGGHPRCMSPFGVHHLSGNLEEWTTIDGSTPPRPAMKGAYWQPSRNHCRAAQTAHDRFYHGTETGFRCCKDANN